MGVVVADITNPFYPELLDILHNEFALANYRTILLNERTDAQLEQHVAQLINGGAVDGLVYVSAVLGMPLPGRGSSARPVVLLNREISSATTDAVVSDNRGGGRAVAEALLNLGHRRIALIAGPENTSTSRDRELGFTEQLRASGAPLDERLRRVGQFSHKSGYQWCLDLLAADPRPTALFAANDVIAFGALDAARRLRVRFPRSYPLSASTTSTWRDGRDSTSRRRASRSPRWRAPPPGSSWSESTPESPCLPEGESSRSSSSTWTTLAAAPPG